MTIDQSSVVLTGAAGGLGSAIARCLHAEGARVLLVGRNADALLALAQSLSVGAQDRSRIDALVVDITTAQGRDSIIDAAAARGANVLINNAALSMFGAVGEALDVEVERMVHTNLIAPMLLTAGLLPQFRKLPAARILNVGSVVGSLGVPGYAAYGASKAALRLYSESLRRELADTSIRVQYYAPRGIRTPFNSAQADAFNDATGSHSDAPATVARAIVHMLQGHRNNGVAGSIEAIATRINALFPSLLDGAFAKHRRALQHPSSSTGVAS